MSRPSKLWLIPLACVVVALWKYWPADRKAVPATPSLQPEAVASPSAPKDRADDPPAKPGEAPAESRVAAVPSSLPPTQNVRPPIDPPLQVVLQAPNHVRVGDNFDVRIMLAGRQAIASVVVDVAYDPALLRVRTLEEIDYVVRMAGDGAFAIRESSDGQAELVLRQRGAALTLPASAALVQFEAIAPGTAQVLIRNASAIDTSERAAQLSGFAREIPIVID